jgi:pyruvate dehydrogenase E1 component beta subunit
MLRTAIRDPDPVLFLEPQRLYRKGRAEVPDGEHMTPFGKVRVAREGRHCTVVAWSSAVELCSRACDELASEGIECKLIDLRSLVPLDVEAVLESVGRTSRLFTVEENPRLCGWGAEIMSIVADEGFWSLDAPLVRITTPHIPLPSAATLEDLAIPSVERIVDTVRRKLDESR